MAAAFRATAFLAGFWLAAAVAHFAPPAPAGDQPSWSDSRLPDAGVIHRSRTQLRSGVLVAGAAVLPAPLLLVQPPRRGSTLAQHSTRERFALLGGTLGARGPPA